MGLVRWRFTGAFDGRDTIRIQRDKIVWEHHEWEWPAGVAVNGKPLPPQTPHIPLEAVAPVDLKDIDFKRTTLQAIRVRGNIALQTDDNAAAIVIDDHQLGADNYEFEIVLRTADAVR